MATRKPITKKKTLTHKEPLVDSVKFLSHSWRDQKTLTVLGDDGYIYVFSPRNNKLKKLYNLKG